jgi:hypothetical protein
MSGCCFTTLDRRDIVFCLLSLSVYSIGNGRGEAASGRRSPDRELPAFPPRESRLLSSPSAKS